MGSPEHGSLKRRVMSSKVTTISQGEMEVVRLGVPPVQERANQLVVETKAQPARRRAQSSPHEVPLNQAR
jgi:hypothetical protein